MHFLRLLVPWCDLLFVWSVPLLTLVKPIPLFCLVHPCLRPPIPLFLVNKLRRGSSSLGPKVTVGKWGALHSCRPIDAEKVFVVSMNLYSFRAALEQLAHKICAEDFRPLTCLLTQYGTRYFFMFPRFVLGVCLLTYDFGSPPPFFLPFYSFCSVSHCRCYRRG